MLDACRLDVIVFRVVKYKRSLWCFIDTPTNNPVLQKHTAPLLMLSMCPHTAPQGCTRLHPPAASTCRLLALAASCCHWLLLAASCCFLLLLSLLLLLLLPCCCLPPARATCCLLPAECCCDMFNVSIL